MKPATVAITVLFVFLLGGCQSAPTQSPSEAATDGIEKQVLTGGIAEQELAAGIINYEEGNYREATRQLRFSLDYGLSRKADRVSARKHLAFIYCTSGRAERCRDEFKMALKIDPTFSLAANEAGHPMWGPTFRGVQANAR